MTDEETRQFVEDELANLSVGEAEDPVNFVDEVVSFLQGWSNIYDSPVTHDKPAYSCFVKCDRVTQVADSLEGFSLQRNFRDDTPQNLLGQIYLCSSTLQTVYSKPINVANSEEVEREIESLSFGPQVVVIFNAANKKASWRTNANAELAPILVTGSSPDDLLTKDFDNELVQFHIECTATPSGYAHPWKSAAKLLPRENLENGIRDSLCLFLRPRNRKSLMVTREPMEPTGRADLKVYFIAERVAYFLELKVLKVKESNGTKVPEAKMVDWAKKGVAQAHSYRLANDPLGVAYACCYDARGKDEEIKELEEYARSMNVVCRRYFMYPSPEEFQRSFMN